MRKCYIDTETSGLDSKLNAIVQIAMIIEDENGKVVDKYSSYVKPFEGSIITDEAMLINGITQKQLYSAPTEDVVLKEFMKLLDGKYQIAGYNTGFDIGFIKAMFDRNNQNFWTHFDFYDCDVYALVKIFNITGERFDEKKKKVVPCKKLSCICELFDIKLKAHCAISDIKATRKLFKKIMKRFDK